MAEPADWTIVSAWGDTNSNSERDKRKTFVAKALPAALATPHTLAQAACSSIVTSAKHIINVAELPQRSQLAALFAIAIRRSCAAINSRAMVDMCAGISSFIFDSSVRIHRRSLAADFCARAFALHPHVSTNAVFASGGSFIKALPALLQELGDARRWAKRTMLQTKDAQEDLYAEVARFRAAVFAIVEVLVSDGSLKTADVLLPILNETGYKARDLATNRSLIATVAYATDSDHGPTDRLMDVVRTRTPQAAPPLKAQQKARFQKNDQTTDLWLWDDRMVGYWARVCCGVLRADPQNEAALRGLYELCGAPSPEATIDVACAITAGLAVADMRATTLERLFDRLISGLLSPTGGVVVAALDALRQLQHAMVTALATTATRHLVSMEITRGVAGWLSPFYDSLQHIHAHHGGQSCVMRAALTCWLEGFALLLYSGGFNDSELANAVDEARGVVRGVPEWAKDVLVRVLKSLTPFMAADAAPREAFGRPLVGLLSDVVIAADDPHRVADVVALFYDALDRPQEASQRAAKGADTDALALESYTLLALADVVEQLSATDTRLFRALDLYRAYLARWTGRDEADDARQQAMRERLFEATVVAGSDRERVALMVAMTR